MRVKGTVLWFSRQKGYGFIAPHSVADDVFVHYNSIAGDGFRELAKHEVVEFEIEAGPGGRPHAVHVTRLSKHATVSQ